MPFWRTYYHLVWATKNRAELITPSIEARMFPYIINKAGDLGVSIYEINGWTEHMHIVAAIPPKLAVAHVVKRLKGASAFDLNQSGKFPDQFQWQRGYGVLTLGETQRARAEEYVRSQKHHHAEHSTNSWLEKVDEFDEGPPDLILGNEDIPTLREASHVYKTDDDWLF